MNSGLSTSTRVENCCPILMNVGPSRMSPSFSHFASSVRFAETFSLDIPPGIFLYVPFLPSFQYLIANENAKE